MKAIRTGLFCAIWKEDASGILGDRTEIFKCQCAIDLSASWDRRNSHIIGFALFSHPHRRNSHVNVFFGNSLKKTGTTPMLQPYTNTWTQRDSIMWL